MTTAYISHPDTLLHIMDGSHPESPARITAIKNALVKQGLFQKLKTYEAPVATDRELQRVHSAAYIQKIRALSPKAGLVRLDADTAMSPMSLSAALHASGAVIFATDLVMRGMADNAFCCIRPPGHHAGRANSAGFCIFNHVAVGVAHAFEKYGIKRAAIIDFDVHHGDGTEDIFQHDPRVMLCSTFQHPFYPHRGADSRSDKMLNIPLPAKSGRKAFQQVFEQDFLPALNAFKPEIIYISAGFDAHAEDPLADLALENTDYGWITQFIKQVAKQHAQGRIISSLEGGYHLPALGEAACSHVQALLE
ncbi:MAG: deacetylase [Methylotenera sp. 24-45-7]|jgi:acetoin utilization deacetylase AcuC-like enzyme|nr:MAG: deacetylase [Mehylophilales bacterium 35-46-6]OYZ41430.1 MAG: deacetylase [Methylotenera sp. 24-45-7]OZA09707.1 MAG: deacetylase [Methylotenera sp. 17-45-7]OZA54523.1 MAG: deacetylase [Methylophilales bacterium 39-45-7]HQS36750.1 histone deacetylase family protein [Methylotenera sp.]